MYRRASRSHNITSNDNIEQNKQTQWKNSNIINFDCDV